MVSLVSRQGRQLQRYSDGGRRLVVGSVLLLSLFLPVFFQCLGILEKEIFFFFFLNLDGMIGFLCFFFILYEKVEIFRAKVAFFFFYVLDSICMLECGWL